MKPNAPPRTAPPFRHIVPAMCLTAQLAVSATILGNTAYAQEQDEAPCTQSLSSWCELSDEQSDFLQQSRLATLPYINLTAAMADGFRPVGADAPAMGRHWVNFKRLFDGEINAAKPEILMYADVNGRDSLVGIGFGYAVGRETRTPIPANPFRPDA